MQRKFVDSLVDLAEKQEVEQTVATQQIEKVRNDVRSHISNARMELQQSVNWLKSHSTKDSGQAQEASTSSSDSSNNATRRRTRK